MKHRINLYRNYNYISEIQQQNSADIKVEVVINDEELIASLDEIDMKSPGRLNSYLLSIV